MTLVRVYCGLASADSSAVAPGAQAWLTVALVDDSGRLLDICEVSDDAGGYAELCALLAQRGDGPGSVAVATHTDDPVVTQLLNAAGRYLAYTDEDSADDYAERFADDASADEVRSGPAERRSVGLARALQAGVLSAVPQAPPRDLIALKPLLSAHAAMVGGRQQAAGTLREVLRELYPAALRAFADPAEQVPLAVLDALPEPGQLVAGAGGRTREGQVITELVDAGVAERTVLTEAVTALRVAVAETPRRSGVTRAMTSAVAETVRQAVIAVRAADGGAQALVEVINDRMARPGQNRGSALAAAVEAAMPSLRVVSEDDKPLGRRARSSDPDGESVLGADPLGTGSQGPGSQGPGSQGGGSFGGRSQGGGSFGGRSQGGGSFGGGSQGGGSFGGSPLAPARGEPGFGSAQPAAALTPVAPLPASPPLTPRGGAPTAIPPSTRQHRPAAPAPAAELFGGAANRPGDDPLNDTVARGSAVTYPAVGHLPPSGQLPPTVAPQTMGRRSADRFEAPAEPNGFRTGSFPPATGSFPPVTGSFPVRGSGHRINDPAGTPNPRLSPEVPAPGSRSSWPLTNDPTGLTGPLTGESAPGPIPTGAADLPRLADLPRSVELPRQREGRVTPPWQADDLPAEPPTLRLVEPAPLADPALATGSGAHNELSGELRFDPPNLRLVDAASGELPVREAPRSPEVPSYREPMANRRGRTPDIADLPVAVSEDDSDLLIFAECRSAWFTDPSAGADEVEWATAADQGWQAAQLAARPAVGSETGAGLPRRVPQQNLVPGSPIPDQDRPLRIVRDAASIAAHTSGYFRGYRRGQEVGGFSVGGRPGRERTDGWDFSREITTSADFTQPSSDYEYRSAR